MPSLFEVSAGKLAGPTTGGTVTQATNKTTGVTLNTESGQITMNNAALGAAGEASFTVTNDKIAATDVVVGSLLYSPPCNPIVSGCLKFPIFFLLF